MGFLEVMLIIICFSIVVSVIITSIIRKKQGKTSCGYNCSSCRGCNYSNKQNNK